MPKLISPIPNNESYKNKLVITPTGYVGDSSLLPKPDPLKQIEDNLGRLGTKAKNALIEKIKPLFESSATETIYPDPTATPQPKMEEKVLGASTERQPFYFDYTNSKINVGDDPRTGTPFPLSQPYDTARNVILQNFPNEATQAAVISNTEAGYNSNSVNRNNSPGKGIDVGLFQINENTFRDYQTRAINNPTIRKYFKDNGIPLNQMNTDEFEKTMKNPMLNAAMAKLIYDYQGPDAWYGPSGHGIQLTK